MPSVPSSRRTFLTAGAGAAAAVAVGAGTASAAPHTALADVAEVDTSAGGWSRTDREIEEMTIAQMQAGMADGTLTSRRLVRAYLRRIRKFDERRTDLRSIIEVNAEAIHIARELDRERREGTVRGPLHGIPIVLKDNIDTDDSMNTTAGSFALAD